MQRCVPRSGWSPGSSGSDGHGEDLDVWRPNCGSRAQEWKTCRIVYNNIWRRTSQFTTETNADGLKLSTMERTISSASLLPSGCQSRNNGVVGQWSNVFAKFTTPKLQNSITHACVGVDRLRVPITRGGAESMGGILRRESLC